MSEPLLLPGIPALCDHVAGLPEPLFVGIDGYSGSGKSTVAASLADRFECTVVHGDDFYADLSDAQREALEPDQGYDQYFDWPRLRWVLTRLRAGEETWFEQFDWTVGRGLVDGGYAKPSPVVIVEGVYACRPELVDLIGLKVLVETPPATRRARIGMRGENPEVVARWTAAESYYFSAVRSRTDFDVILPGTSLAGRSQRS